MFCHLHPTPNTHTDSVADLLVCMAGIQDRGPRAKRSLCTSSVGQFRVCAYTALTNRQVCLLGVGKGSERGTFPSNFRCGSILHHPSNWVYILQSPGVDGKLYEIMDQAPRVILYSNHLRAQPDENIGQYGRIVYVLMTDVDEHPLLYFRGIHVAPNVDPDSDGNLGVKQIDLASLARGVTPVVPPEEDHWDQGDGCDWSEDEEEECWSEKEDTAGAPEPGVLPATDVANLVYKVPCWIPRGSPTIFQNKTGDPYNSELVEPEMDTWGAHVLRSKVIPVTFMYWYHNMMDRHHALSAKKWYVPEATGYTAQDLAKMNVEQLAKQMVGYTANLTGTKANKAKLRKLILAMVKQIEIETRTGPQHARDEGSEGGAHAPAASAAIPWSLGDMPCLFGTLTTQRYQWDEIIRIIAPVEPGIEEYWNLSKSKRRELVPLFVAWYCAVGLELSLKTIVAPFFGVSAYVAVFEWSSTGGLVHLHYILWKRGAQRFGVRAEGIVEQADVLVAARFTGQTGSRQTGYRQTRSGQTDRVQTDTVRSDRNASSRGAA